ncbi:MAG TPA: patatin-like phospholipase family protein [Solirubrobacterales bacterium]|nr:patatin-like phospholipase family protein [Solirubrobacterales bacterium]
MSGHPRRGAEERPTLGRLGGLARDEIERGEKALWLAGGGFRAALFHLGALTRLNELGLLARTGTVGAVAGGSIVAALLATRVPWPLHGAYRDWPERVAEPLREITRRNVRARSLLRRPLGGPGAALEERYARELLAELGEEPEWGPRFVFGASGLTLSGLAAGWEECIEWDLELPTWGGYDERLVAETIATVRTDLDAFGEAEQAVLENHGYLLADAALRADGHAAAVAIEPLPPLPPHPRWMDPERVRAALGSSSRRTPIGRLRSRRAQRGERQPQPRTPELTALLERHRPLLRYDSLECSRADSAATICSLAAGGRSNSLHRADGTLIATAAPAPGEARLELSLLGASAYADGQPAGRGDYLDECGGSLAADALALRADPALADVVYGRARRGAAGTLWLQYWLFFYFADRGHLGIEQHEGDWQLVQIGLGKEAEPRVATLARAGGALRLAWEQVETAAGEDGPVAVVYPARGSHTPLPRAGTFAAPVVPDHNDGGGALVRPRLEPIGDDGPGWVRWPGRWGATRRREYFEAESPRGPGLRPEWWDPGELEREAEPWDGEASARAGPAPPPAPQLQARREDGLALVEYSFPEPAPGAAAARLVAAPVDAGGEAGPARALAIDRPQGSFALQLPPQGEWVGVRAGAASERGLPGPVSVGALATGARAGSGNEGERAG